MAASMPNPEMIKKNKEDIATLNANLNAKKGVKYKDMTAETSEWQVNSGTGNVVNKDNFISAFVVGSNSICALPYTYSNYVYVKLLYVSNLQSVPAGSYTVRVLYYE